MRTGPCWKVVKCWSYCRLMNAFRRSVARSLRWASSSDREIKMDCVGKQSNWVLASQGYRQYDWDKHIRIVSRIISNIVKAYQWETCKGCCTRWLAWLPKLHSLQSNSYGISYGTGSKHWSGLPQTSNHLLKLKGLSETKSTGFESQPTVAPRSRCLFVGFE